MAILGAQLLQEKYLAFSDCAISACSAAHVDVASYEKYLSGEMQVGCYMCVLHNNCHDNSSVCMVW
jgi:hypothetical protein